MHEGNILKYKGKIDNIKSIKNLKYRQNNKNKKQRENNFFLKTSKTKKKKSQIIIFTNPPKKDIFNFKEPNRK